MSIKINIHSAVSHVMKDAHKIAKSFPMGMYPSSFYANDNRTIYNLEADMDIAKQVRVGKVKFFFKSDLAPDIKRFLAQVKKYCKAQNVKMSRAGQNAFNRLQEYLQVIPEIAMQIDA